MKVSQVAETTPVEADHVYVIPPGVDLTMNDGQLRVEHAVHRARFVADTRTEAGLGPTRPVALQRQCAAPSDCFRQHCGSLRSRFEIRLRALNAIP